MILSDSLTSYNKIFYRYFIENSAIVETRELDLYKQMYEDNIDNSNLTSYFI